MEETSTTTTAASSNDGPVDWNQLIDEYNNKMGVDCDDNEAAVGGKTDSANRKNDNQIKRRHTSTEMEVDQNDLPPLYSSSVSDGDLDVLDLYCDDEDDGCFAHEENGYVSTKRSGTEFPRARRPSPHATEHDNENRLSGRDRWSGFVGGGQSALHHNQRRNTLDVNYNNGGGRSSSGEKFRSDRQRRSAGRKRRSFRGVGGLQTAAGRKDETHVVKRPRSYGGRTAGVMALRWVRHGYEDLVFDVCNCNESPNVVFAALCRQQRDVYSMVLRNCAGTRRYWYDKCVSRSPAPSSVSDFEHALRDRANAVGRSSTSPGYDLAAFVLQNVSTDRRYAVDGSAPLILVTTDNALAAPSIRRQLLMLWQTAPPGMRINNDTYDKKRPPCYKCRAPSCIVTDAGSNIPVFTCPYHSALHMGNADAATTRVCNAVVVDLEFVREEGNSPSQTVVCRLRLIDNNGGSDVGRVIAELVSVPAEVPRDVPSDRRMLLQRGCGGSDDDDDSCCYRTRDKGVSVLRTVDLDAAHASTCSDRHYNAEDLVPSGRAIDSGGEWRVRYYDTTIGFVVDQMHCLASAFRRKFA